MSDPHIWERIEPRKNKHIQHWLKFNRLLSDTDDTILKECMNEVLDTFGGWNNLFMFISKFAEQSQIESMYKALINLKLNHQSIDNPSTEQQNTTEDEDIEIKDVDNQECLINPFLILPNETLGHICSFLSRSKINIFKLTSRQIGIICLEEQTKVGVSVLNSNEFMTNDMNLYDFKYGSNTFKRSRHNSNKRLYSFFQEWEEKYNIPENNQLIATFPHHSGYTMCYIKDLKPMRLKAINTIKVRRFLVCDNRKIVILNKKSATRFDIEKDSIKKLSDYRLIILEFFDVLKQQVNVIQFLLIHNEISYLNILEYIEHNYIYINTINNKWHKELKLILKQMNYDRNCPKLCIYKHSSSYSLKLITDTDVGQTALLYCGHTIQLNPNHTWFKQTSKIDDIKAICIAKMDAFHLTVSEFCKNVLNAEVNYKGNVEILKTGVERYYESIFPNEQEREVFDEDLQTTLKFIDGFNSYSQKIKTFKTSLSGSIRIKIAHEFKNIIKPANIELFDYDYNNRKAWNKTLGHSIKFDIVLYDTEKYILNNDIIYRIRINNINDAPYPFLNDISNNYFTFKYRKEFKIKRFLNDMFGSINRAKQHLLRYQFEDLLQVYYGDKNRKQSNNNITYIIADRSSSGYYFGTSTTDINAYTLYDKYKHNQSGHSFHYNYVSIVKLDLYMIETRKEETLKVKLKIKFVSRSNEKFSTKIDINKLKKIKWVGMPMVLWINKSDTLQYIMDNYLSDDVKKCIQFTYRVITDEKIVSIAKGKRKKYKPYYEFLRDEDNDDDYIVLLLTKTKDARLCVFPRNVHKQLHS